MRVRVEDEFRVGVKTWVRVRVRVRVRVKVRVRLKIRPETKTKTETTNEKARNTAYKEACTRLNTTCFLYKDNMKSINTTVKKEKTAKALQQGQCYNRQEETATKQTTTGNTHYKNSTTDSYMIRRRLNERLIKEGLERPPKEPKRTQKQQDQ